MRIALAQLNYVIGDFENNVRLIRENIAKARTAGADLVVFSELCVCGYPPRDFLEFNDFISQCRSAVKEIAKHCTDIYAIIGVPIINPKIEGKNLFNSALLLGEGKILDEVHKSLLPNYDVFDEYRYFEPAQKFHCVNIKGVKVALTICEDLWNIDDDPMYVSAPMDFLSKENPQLMINIAASPFDYRHAEERKGMLLKNVRQFGIPLVYVNHTGAQTELIFDGGSVAYNKSGETIAELDYFREDFAVVEFDSTTNDLLSDKKNAHTTNKPLGEIETIYCALITGIRDYFRKQNFKKAILGLSGGVDSALVTVLAAEALGPENVHVLMMPSEFSSEGSISHSQRLIENIGVTHDTIPIKDIYEEHLLALKPYFKDLPFSVAEENLQARIRAALLMAQSNKFGYILLNTSNKSEIAVGYGTLYGDMCGGISVLGDVYKTQVFRICRHINRQKEIIPEIIITKPPSAELRPGQKDSDSLPEYDLLDKVLFSYIEERKGPNELIAMGFDKDIVLRILKLVNTNEYKRYQTPPILRVSPKAFGTGRRLPIVGKYLS